MENEAETFSRLASNMAASSLSMHIHVDASVTYFTGLIKCCHSLDQDLRIIFKSIRICDTPTLCEKQVTPLLSS